MLVDEALSEAELAEVRAAIEAYGAPEVVGFHKLRGPRAGSRRDVDLHVQFAEGTALRRAHDVSHELQATIGERLRGVHVLIHLEPPDAGSRAAAAPPEAGLPRPRRGVTAGAWLQKTSRAGPP